MWVTADLRCDVGFMSLFLVLFSFSLFFLSPSTARNPARYLDRLSDVVRSMAMHRDQHKVVDCSVIEQSAADNLATIGTRNETLSAAEMRVRLCSNTACEPGFRGSRPIVNASWEQLLGSKPTNANREVNKPGD